MICTKIYCRFVGHYVNVPSFRWFAPKHTGDLKNIFAKFLHYCDSYQNILSLTPIVAMFLYSSDWCQNILAVYRTFLKYSFIFLKGAKFYCLHFCNFPSFQCFLPKYIVALMNIVERFLNSSDRSQNILSFSWDLLKCSFILVIYAKIYWFSNDHRWNAKWFRFSVSIFFVALSMTVEIFLRSNDSFQNILSL